MSACISFIRPMCGCSLYLIVVDDMIIGSIHMEDDIITNIDINNDFFVNIKTRLMRSLLFELGLNQIDLVCNPVCLDFYNELGFEKCEIQSTDGKVVLRYKV